MRIVLLRVLAVAPHNHIIIYHCNIALCIITQCHTFAQAEVAAVLVNRHHVTEASITALTPYSAQKEEIKKRLQDKKLLTIPVKTITESQGTNLYSVLAKHQFHICLLVCRK